MSKFLKNFILLSFCITITFVGCAKTDKAAYFDKPKAERNLMEANDEKEYAGNIQDKRASLKKKKARGQNEKGLKSHFIMPFEHAKERLLEYKVDLTYETKDLLYSRQKLLGLVNKYGFIIKSNSAAEGRYPYVNTTVNIKTDNLYTALKEFDDIGILMNENITAIDHTEQMVLSQKKIQREQLRIARRNRASGKINPTSKNWSNIENSLERSEDKLDANAHEKWKIEDRVSWAKIQLYVRGPENPVEIKVPNYLDAFKTMINAILEFLYGIIVALPFLIIIALIILGVLKRKNIKDFILRKRE